MSREHFLNVDFDLSLRPRWSGLGGGAEARRVHEMALHCLFALAPGDSLLAIEPPAEAFEEFLVARGWPRPRCSVLPELRPEARFTPYGWNAEAAALNRRYRVPVSHPPLAVVQRVNGRRFGAELAALVEGAEFDLGAARSAGELEALLAAAPHNEQGWVVKANHGNAALGNRRLRRRALSAADRRWLGDRLSEESEVVLEPWRRRRADLCCSFEIDRDGELHGLALHEVVNTADGAFIGALFDPRSPQLERWRAPIETRAAALARALARAGYFGPVCVDAFVWDSPSGPALRAVADVNARRHASALVGEWWRREAPDRVVYWRFFLRRKLVGLPRSHAEIERQLGRDAFDPGRRCGVLLSSPLCRHAAAGGADLHTLGMLFAAPSREEVSALHDRVRALWERARSGPHLGQGLS